MQADLNTCTTSDTGCHQQTFGKTESTDLHCEKGASTSRTLIRWELTEDHTKGMQGKPAECNIGRVHRNRQNAHEKAECTENQPNAQKQVNVSTYLWNYCNIKTIAVTGLSRSGLMPSASTQQLLWSPLHPTHAAISSAGPAIHRWTGLPMMPFGFVLPRRPAMPTNETKRMTPAHTWNPQLTSPPSCVCCQLEKDPRVKSEENQTMQHEEPNTERLPRDSHAIPCMWLQVGEEGPAQARHSQTRAPNHLLEICKEGITCCLAEFRLSRRSPWTADVTRTCTDTGDFQTQNTGSASANKTVKFAKFKVAEDCETNTHDAPSSRSKNPQPPAAKWTYRGDGVAIESRGTHSRSRLNCALSIAKETPHACTQRSQNENTASRQMQQEAAQNLRMQLQVLFSWYSFTRGCRVLEKTAHIKMSRVTCWGFQPGCDNWEAPTCNFRVLAHHHHRARIQGRTIQITAQNPDLTCRCKSRQKKKDLWLLSEFLNLHLSIPNPTGINIPVCILCGCMSRWVWIRLRILQRCISRSCCPGKM